MVGSCCKGRRAAANVSASVPADSMLYSPDESPMSSTVPFLNATTLAIVLHLLVIVVFALLLNRFLRVLSNLLIKPAAGQARSEQLREQQTRALAGVVYGAASKVVWVIAILTALDNVGINPLPALALAGVAGIAIGFGAQNLVRDIIAGFYIVLEDQYVAGDTVQIAETSGRVENLTLRRTVVRDARGALVTIANGDIRSVANLSRDWSQSFVDVGLAPEIALDKPMAALEAAASELRGDAPGRSNTRVAPQNPDRISEAGHSRGQRAAIRINESAVADAGKSANHFPAISEGFRR